MRFSIWPTANQPYADVLAVALHAADTGWDGVWIADHFMPNAENNLGPVQEAWTTLAGLASLVPRVRLGTMVTRETVAEHSGLTHVLAGIAAFPVRL